MSSDSDDGLLDTNIFIHAHTHDSFSTECRRFLAEIEAGQLTARLEPLVLHELSYALPRYLRQMTRDDVAQYLLSILSWRGIDADRVVLIDAVRRWRRTTDLAFVDAYLAALAQVRECVVFTKNVAELRGQGVTVPDPLPAGRNGAT